LAGHRYRPGCVFSQRVKTFEAQFYFTSAISKKHSPEALADYDRAIELNPKFVEAYSNRALVKYALNDDKGALADFDRAIELNPKAAS